jgi:hypothetical protein
LNDGLTTYLSLNVNAVTLTVGATADYHTVFGASTIEMKDDSANSVVKIGTAVSDPYIRIQETTSTAYWELRKPDNNNDFYVLPETDSIFAIRNSGNDVSAWGVNTADGVNTKNNIMFQHLGKTDVLTGVSSAHPFTQVMGGTDEEYTDNSPVDLFRFTLATAQCFAAELRVVTWSPENAQNAGSISYYRVFYHKDSGGTIYPATIVAEEVTGWMEDTRTLTGHTIAISNVSGSIYKCTLTLNFGGLSVSRLAYKLDAIGDFTTLENEMV